MKKNDVNFFKKRYLIAEYDDDTDELLHVFDGAKQLADYYHLSLHDACALIYTYVNVRHKRFYLIDLKSVVDDCFLDADIDTIRTMFPCP